MSTQRRRRRPLNATLNPDLLARVKAHSEETGEPVSRILDRALRALLAIEAPIVTNTQGVTRAA